MELEATSNKAPVLRPKSPVYRSYGELIRALTSDATQRVKASKFDRIPPLTVTPPMQRLRVEIIDLRKKLQKAERILADQHKAVVEQNHCGSDPKFQLDYTYSERRRLQEAKPSTYDAQLGEIKRLRVKATLDTIDMTPVQAKKYLLALEARLSKL